MIQSQKIQSNSTTGRISSKLIITTVLLEAPLLYYYIDVTHNASFSFFDHIYVKLFVYRFGRSLRFCHLKFDEKPFLMAAGVKMVGIGGSF